ncbi:MAG: Na+/H+ antiporter NhaC [Bacteroidota bacterium]
MPEQQPKVSLFQAFIPILLLIGLLAINVIYFGGDSSYGPNQIALLLAAGAAACVAFYHKISWKTIMQEIVDSISTAMPALIILLLIGALAGTWLISGIVPTMIYYGLNILSPKIFLFATCIICAIVSLATGSSWSTVATVGVALLGIGIALGIHPGWIGGAIISGAYFGDKMSPLSDTTNLAPAVAGTDLITHIRYMLYTTVPSISLALIVFLIAGFLFEGGADQNQIDEMQMVISKAFNTNLLLFLVPIAVIILIIKKMPAIPALLIGVLLGAIAAAITQPEIVSRISESGNYIEDAYKASIESMALNTTDYFQSENDRINEIFNIPIEDRSNLLKAGGMEGMLNTVWLILCAMIFGGAMQSAGLLRKITQVLLARVRSTGSLVLRTAGTCLFFNATASDQYVAIVVPGKMFGDAFKDKGLAPENLSRTLEDAGTVTSVLIPWNTCGATQAGILGMSVWTFAPYCIFNIVSPFMTVAFAYLGIKIKALVQKETI